VYPASDAVGVVIGDQVKVTFDMEMDEDSINTGTFVVSGVSNDFIFGPDYNPLDEPGVDEEDILSSPGTSTYVRGVITFKRVDENGYEVTTRDTTGDGTLYRTQAIFTPSVPLQPNITYTVLLAGDESSTDDVDVGVSARTVFDTVNFSVAGTGRLTFGGGYTGAGIYRDTYVVEVIKAGAPGTAEYVWYKESAPASPGYGVTSVGRRTLSDGVYITADPDGSFRVGDTFKVVVTSPERLEDNYRWSFTTGSGAITDPPTSESQLSTVVAASEPLEIVSIEPSHRSTDLDPDYFTEIVVTFNKNIDASTITSSTITLWSEPVNGDPQFTASGVLAKVLSVSGKTLTIQIPRVSES
jgi:hypothetical protein